MYTSDSQAHDQDVLQIKFEDDSSLTGLVVDSDETKYSEAVREIAVWCHEHFLDLNITKSEEMIVDFRKEKEQVYPLIIKDKEVVPKVLIYKYLGTSFDYLLCLDP